jgi:hypothetical protein
MKRKCLTGKLSFWSNDTVLKPDRGTGCLTLSIILNATEVFALKW